MGCFVWPTPPPCSRARAGRVFPPPGELQGGAAQGLGADRGYDLFRSSRIGVLRISARSVKFRRIRVTSTIYGLLLAVLSKHTAGGPSCQSVVTDCSASLTIASQHSTPADLARASCSSIRIIRSSKGRLACESGLPEWGRLHLAMRSPLLCRSAVAAGVAACPLHRELSYLDFLATADDEVNSICEICVVFCSAGGRVSTDTLRAERDGRHRLILNQPCRRRRK